MYEMNANQLRRNDTCEKLNPNHRISYPLVGVITFENNACAFMTIITGFKYSEKDIPSIMLFAHGAIESI